jgi:hypothetical protein
LPRRRGACTPKYPEKHIRPIVGRLKAGAVDVEVLDWLYAELRRYRIHCVRSRGLVDHRPPRPHECDSRCRPHRCNGLSSTTIRHIHFVLRGRGRRRRARPRPPRRRGDGPAGVAPRRAPELEGQRDRVPRDAVGASTLSASAETTDVSFSVELFYRGDCTPTPIGPPWQVEGDISVRCDAEIDCGMHEIEQAQRRAASPMEAARALLEVATWLRARGAARRGRWGPEDRRSGAPARWTSTAKVEARDHYRLVGRATGTATCREWGGHPSRTAPAPSNAPRRGGEYQSAPASNAAANMCQEWSVRGEPYRRRDAFLFVIDVTCLRQ